MSSPDQAPEPVTGEIVDPGPADEQSVVREEIDRLRGFVKELSVDELRDGGWFAKLLTFSLDRYTKEVDAAYFRRKYPHLPPDAVVQARIQMAARYASIEGGLSAAAYTGAVAATISTGGLSSPLTISAGAASFAIDLTFTSQLQLRLAHDIAVLYGVPLDLSDPDDLWKLVRIAFGIKAGEVGVEAGLKAVPAVVRPLVKKIFSGATLTTVKSLPVVGKYLLQRNLVKFAVPLVGVPLSTGANYWITKTAGASAKDCFRNEARVIEAARRVCAEVADREALLWVMWLVIASEPKISDNERLLLHHVARVAGEEVPDLRALEDISTVIEVDPKQVWAKVEGAVADHEALFEAARLAAAVDGRVPKVEKAVLRSIAAACDQDYDDKLTTALAKSWSA